MRQTGTSRGRGYFAIGAERISKSLNLGNLMRSAHGFGASFTFTIGATYQALEARADTSKGAQHLPHYDWASLEAMQLPKGCRLVGVELLEDAIDLPSFHHPQQAAYVLGPEKGSLSPALLDALRPRGEDPDQLLHQRGDGRRHRHVRPRALAGPVRAAAARGVASGHRNAASPGCRDRCERHAACPTARSARGWSRSPRPARAPSARG